MRLVPLALALCPALLAPLLLAAPPQAPVGEESTPMTYYWHLEAKPDRDADAHAYLARLKAHLNEHFADDYRFRVFENDTGEGTHLHWFAEFDDLAHFHRVSGKLGEDAGIRALMSEVHESLEWREDLELYPLSGEPGRYEYRLLKVTHSLDSKVPAARRFAMRVAAHLESNYDGLSVRTLSADYQDNGRIYWLFDYVSLPVWQSVRVRLLHDDEYIRLFEEAEGLFLEERTTAQWLSLE